MPISLTIAAIFLSTTSITLVEENSQPIDGIVSTIPLGLESSSSARWRNEANLFVRMPGQKVTSEMVDRRLSTDWLRYSGQNADGDHSSQTIFLDAADPSQAYADVNASAHILGGDYSSRACTEGQGWAMMLAVQMNDRAMFDKLWKFTKQNMQLKSLRADTKRGYYFAWQVRPLKTGGTKLINANDGPAPDGESWISAALCCAAGRWGASRGADYQSEADHILATMLHIDEWNGYKKDKNGNYLPGSDMVNMFQNDQVCFIPAQYEMGPKRVSSHLISDPSYCLPAFYGMFAKVGPKEDRATWRRIARHARTDYFPRALGQSKDSPNDNRQTAISPYQTYLDGTQYDADGESGHITSGDGLRTPSNIGLDFLWWSDGSNEFSYHPKIANTLQRFLADPTVANSKMQIAPFSKGGWPYDYNRFWYGVYYTNGRDWVIKNSSSQGNNSSNHNEASTGMNAVASHAATVEERWKFVEELWGCHQPRASRDFAKKTYGEPYWDGTLYLLGLLETAGRMRPYIKK